MLTTMFSERILIGVGPAELDRNNSKKISPNSLQNLPSTMPFLFAHLKALT